MQYLNVKKTLTIVVASACLGLLSGCGGANQAVHETDPEATEGDRSDGALGKDVQEMTDAEGLDETVEQACEDGDAACEGDDGDALDTDKEGDGPDVEDDGASDETADADRGVDPKVAWRRRIARGKQVFIKRCDFCHPDGDEDTGPKLRGIRWPVQKTVAMVRKGKGKMKPMPPAKISGAQMRDLLAYLSTMRAVRGVKRP